MSGIVSGLRRKLMGDGSLQQSRGRFILGGFVTMFQESAHHPHMGDLFVQGLHACFIVHRKATF